MERTSLIGSLIGMPYAGAVLRIRTEGTYTPYLVIGGQLPSVPERSGRTWLLLWTDESSTVTRAEIDAIA